MLQITIPFKSFPLFVREENFVLQTRIDTYPLTCLISKSKQKENVILLYYKRGDILTFLTLILNAQNTLNHRIYDNFLSSK